MVALSAFADSSEPEVYEEFKRIAGEEHEREQTETQKLLDYRNNAVAILSSCGYEYSQPPESWDQQNKMDFNTQVKSRLSYQFVREPLSVTHCALHASRGVYYIPEIRNWGETCAQFDPRSNLPICSKCVHYQPSDTERKNRAETVDLISGMGISERDAAGILSQRASEVTRGMAHAKAHDLRTAYNSRGRLQERLAYLPFCEVQCHSCSERPNLDCAVCGGEGVQRVQPEIFNRFLGCQVFQPASVNHAQRPQAASEQESPTQEPPVHNTPPRMGVDTQPRTTILQSLGLSPFSSPSAFAPKSQEGGLVHNVASHAVGFVFEHIRDFRDRTMASQSEQAQAEHAIDEHEIAESSLDVLIPGSPPLTNEMLRRSVAVAKALIPRDPGNFESDYSQFVGGVWSRQLTDIISMQLRFIRMYPPDSSRSEWHTEASQLFKTMAASARTASGRPTAAQAGRPTQRPAPDAATNPSPSTAPKTCKAGHQNPPERIFCITCGKPLPETLL